MGTLVSSPTAVAAFDGQIVKKGLDLNRSIIHRDLGTEVVNPTAQVRAGQLVTRDATGYIAQATGTMVYGVAKWGSAPFGVGVVTDLPMVLNGTTATATGYANISNVTVRSAPDMGGTLYVGAGTDYNAVAVAGTIARDATTTITDGQTVYATFTYALVDADFNFDGRFFQNQAADRTLYQEARITVITDWARLFTIEWTTGDLGAGGGGVNATYALTGVLSNLYCSPEGKFTNDTAGGASFVGRVYQLPTAQDPYMGLTAHGNPVV
ncbi:hypothetical protein Rctr197k_048 [Virus Rctr197k]|nr:hypothetical protein Rctr197k_048 [Virus Rctr197k]